MIQCRCVLIPIKTRTATVEVSQCINGECPHFEETDSGSNIRFVGQCCFTIKPKNIRWDFVKLNKRFPDFCPLKEKKEKSAHQKAMLEYWKRRKANEDRTSCAPGSPAREGS